MSSDDEFARAERICQEAEAHGGRHPLYPNYGADDKRHFRPEQHVREGKERPAEHSFWD